METVAMYPQCGRRSEEVPGISIFRGDVHATEHRHNQPGEHIMKENRRVQDTMEKVSSETVSTKWQLPNLAPDHLAREAGKGIGFIVGAIVRVPTQAVKGVVEGFQQSF
jgi:hypothetical protein